MNKTRIENNFTITLINARSLLPKLDTLAETLEEFESDVAVVTETWFREDQRTNTAVTDFESTSHFKIIRRDRQSSIRGGGVAICFDSNKIDMHQAKLPRSKHEIVAALGRRKGQRKKVLVLALYVPPWYTAEDNNDLYETINAFLGLLLTRYTEPYVLIAGDLNRRDMKRATYSYPSIKEIKTPPTRGANVLDVIATDSLDLVASSGVSEPLESHQGLRSDHKIVFARLRMPRVPTYTIQKYSYYNVTDEGKLKFGHWIKEQTWETVFREVTPTAKVRELHGLFGQAMKRCFRWTTRKKKSTEPPWMTDEIRDQIRDRRELFVKYGRKGPWIGKKTTIASKIKKRKEKFDAGIFDKLLGNCQSRNFFQCVNTLLSDGKAGGQWDVRSLAPEKTDLELAESLADFFNAISSEYKPLDRMLIPEGTRIPLPNLGVFEVEERLRKNKKPSSMVPGDIPPSLYALYSAQIAIPVTNIFNCMSDTLEWADLWNVEYVTIIPKSPNAAEAGDCRNISCTNYLSKVYESFVLEWARKEVVPRTNQYGGEKNCGTEHFLVSTAHYISEYLEDSRSACILTAVDFSKAFNRLDHLKCLQAFSKRGASNGIIRILAAFMSGRKMTVKVGNERSAMRQVNAGAPQGSVLGTYLFNIGTDDLDEGCVYTQTLETVEHHTHSSDYPTCSTPKRVSTYQQDALYSPIHGQPQHVSFLPTAVNVPPWLRAGKEPNWQDKAPENKRYIDDSLHLNAVNMKKEKLMIKGGKPVKIIHPTRSQEMLNHITRNAEDRGMKVNDSKTKVLCISAATSFKAEAVLSGRAGEKIEGQSTLKVLGFWFDSDGSVRSQAEHVCQRLRARAWALRALKRRGMDETSLLRVYKGLIRPAAEYAPVAWHSRLTEEQSTKIEKQQVHALRHIFGWGISADKMREKGQVEKLADRREARCLKFANKCVGSSRFSSWFPLREAPVYGRRGGVSYRTYKEESPRTERYRKDPINYMRSLLNK